MKADYDVFANYYDLEYGQFTDDLDFYLDLARRSTPPVLELACGTGRVSIRVAQAGIPITGVDVSAEMLAHARAKAESIGDLPLTLVEGDMRTFELEERFGLVIIPGRSFLHMLTPEDQKTALLNIHRHLIKGGRLALNIFVPDIRLIAEHMGGLLGRPLKFSHEFVDPTDEQRVVVWQDHRYDPYRQRIHVHMVYERLDDDGTVLTRQHKSYTLCYIFEREMRHLLELCGYEIEGLYGYFDMRPFTSTSTEMVWVARKAS